MKIYVIRHGITELNKQKKVNGQIDESLALEGVKQANEAIRTIPASVRYMYSSALKRAIQTTEIINSKHHFPIVISSEFSEIHMGKLAGFSWDEMTNGQDFKKKHRSVKFNYQPYGGESVEQVKKRLKTILTKIAKNHKDNEVLIVTHGGIIRVMYLLEQNKIIDETKKHLSVLTFDLNKILSSL